MATTEETLFELANKLTVTRATLYLLLLKTDPATIQEMLDLISSDVLKEVLQAHGRMDLQEGVPEIKSVWTADTIEEVRKELSEILSTAS